MLTDAQKQHYDDHGFVAPIDIFTANEIASIRADIEAADEQYHDELAGAGRNNAHYVLPVLDAITHDSRILDAVERLIGRDILVCGTTLFIKPPHTEGFVSWHQDARYIGLEPHDWVTGWVALCDVSLENGCMQMIPGSHKTELADHVDTFHEDNLLTRGQTVPDVDEASAVPVEMKVGQLSLHHPRVIHGSGPNLSQTRRLGFAIQSYIAPHVDQVIGTNWAQLARGTDIHNHHPIAARPTGVMQTDDLAMRQTANAELTKIFYAGANQIGKY
jgi:hypothetical protein